jgi:hypothetical protein
MAYMTGQTSNAATPTTAKALRKRASKRDRTIAKARATGDSELIDYALRHGDATSMKKVRRGVWLAKADQAQRLGDHDLAKSYLGLAKRSTKVRV